MRAGGLAAVAVAVLSSCTGRHVVSFRSDYQTPAVTGSPVPLRIGLRMPEEAAMPPSVTPTRCAFGKSIVTVPYAEAYGRMAYELAGKRFESVESVAGTAGPAGRYDAILEFKPARFTPASYCAVQYMVSLLIFPLFAPPETWIFDMEAGARLLDSSGRKSLAEKTLSRSQSATADYMIEDAFAGLIGDILADMTAAPRFIEYSRSARRARVEGPEREGDSAAKQGRASQALASYIEAYRAYPKDHDGKAAVLAKLLDVARLMSPPPAVPEASREHASRAEAFVKLAENPAGFAKAAAEYEKALEAAPWWAEAYYNQGLAREKAGDKRGAARSLKRFLLAAPEAPEADAVKQRIVELQVAEELKRGPAETVEGPDGDGAVVEKAVKRKEKGGGMKF